MESKTAEESIKRWDFINDGMYEDPAGYWVYLQDHERVKSELESQLAEKDNEIERLKRELAIYEIHHLKRK